MTERSHGYDVPVGYTYGFFREMAPEWLDLCAWIGGFEPPRRDASAYRYLELGCGQGFGLCLLAAANPGAEFVGVDFNPEHIAHAQGLTDAAGLSNVRFVQADFLDLAEDWPRDFGTFEYVALHGILTWVSAALCDAVVRCLSHATAPGGLVYASYNAQPGCLSAIPLRHFSRRIKQATNDPGAGAVDRSVALLDRLAAANAPIFKVLPALKARVDVVKTRHRNYLVAEYLTDSWNLFWHSEIVQAFGGADLDYVASATMADNLTTEFLPLELHDAVMEQSTEALRQDVQDFIINQAFRRDIFCRGATPRGSGGNPVSMEALPVYLAASVKADRSLNFLTSLGQINWEPAIFASIFEALASGPKPLGELMRLPNATLWKPRHVLLLLLHSTVLAPQAAHAGDAGPAQRLNAAIARAVCGGAPYDHVAAARLGSAIPASQEELLLLDAWFESNGEADLSTLADGLDRRLAKLGRSASDRTPAAASFVAETLPRWRRLGVVG